MDDPRDFRLLLIPNDGSETRTWEVRARTVRMIKVAAWSLAIVLLAGAGSLAWLASEARRIPVLEARVTELQDQQTRVQSLAAQLEQLEARYGGIRSLFGVDTIRDPGDFWLPPADRPSLSRAGDDTSGSRPASWPLSQAGFITQTLLDQPDAAHPGLDIAIPTDTWIRAAGAGVVVAVGEDPVYGNFVELDHGEGFSTLYGHASRTVVTAGQTVRRNEVIAMSGSSGRSTAPHLHFEIRIEGQPVDPLEYIRQPG